MGSAGLVEKPGNEIFIVMKVVSADRAYPGAFTVQAMGAAVNVHKPVCLAHGGEGRGFDPLAVYKPDGTDRTGPGHPGFAFQIAGVALPAPAGRMVPGFRSKEKTIPKVEKAHAENDKTQNLKIRIHSIVSIVAGLKVHGF
jgi:hypothetical protein